MKLRILCLLFVGIYTSVNAQKKESWLDYSMKPVKDRNGAYYYTVVEKKDTVWYQKAYFFSLGSMAWEGGYKDENCTVAHGLHKQYHHNRYLRSSGEYVNGKKQGTWLQYNEQGVMDDSSTYEQGHRKGIGLAWFDNGYLSDSTYFDGAGNGTEVHWYNGGTVSSAGKWMQDTLKKGRWNYYHRNGKVMATEDYDEKGKMVACNCYDETGIKLDSALCSEQEPKVDITAWRRFLERYLQPVVEAASRKVKPGQYVVIVRFLVKEDGQVSDVKALTNYGHGIEEGVVKIMAKAPVWQPPMYHGRKVKSYHSQPITFVISE